MPASNVRDFATKLNQDVAARPTPNSYNTLSLNPRVRSDFLTNLASRKKWIKPIQVLLSEPNKRTWLTALDNHISKAKVAIATLTEYFEWSGAKDLVNSNFDKIQREKAFVQSVFRPMLIELAGWKMVLEYLNTAKNLVRGLSEGDIVTQQLKTNIQLIKDSLKIIESCFSPEETLLKAEDATENWTQFLNQYQKEAPKRR